ncbi:MAG TPA: alpha/beta hydrolase-fold protein [Anaerolineales bacterium]|nr:alpha/beta hydrolase-fold protein [Anaerolineales bacterium]
MHRHLDGWHSPHLNMHMDIVTYGHYGFPLLMFPTAAADYLEYERFLVIDAIAPHIDSGKVKLFSINSINKQGWLNPHEHPKYKALWQVAYNKYISEEVVPYIWNSCQGHVGIITAGASLGAFHAANQLFRRPDLFDGMIAMSGGYDIRSYYKSDYYDENVYFNNPVDYLPNLNDEQYLPMLRQKKQIYILTGQGSYEDPDASRRLAGILASKGIPFHLDLWGYDMPHDWPTWRAMMRYYLAEKF